MVLSCEDSLVRKPTLADYVLKSGSITLAAVFLRGKISPAQITSDQNNYAPTGHATATVLRLGTDASRALTGLQGGTDGAVKLIMNVGANDLILRDESSSSSAANRFLLGGDLTVPAGTGVGLWYDSTDSRWRRFTL